MSLVLHLYGMYFAFPLFLRCYNVSEPIPLQKPHITQGNILKLGLH